MKFEWENGFKIEVIIENDTVRIVANKEGLISLARHLVTLSQEEYCKGNHFHLDSSNSLEVSSKELIIEMG